jgi:DNA repair exonuclease SbcCD nuclease subunit
MPASEVRLLHTSDVHLAHQREPDGTVSDNLPVLDRLLGAAERWQADAVLFAGDTFDHIRLSDEFLQRVANRLARARRPVVILPGNHDPLVDESVYYRAALRDLPDLHVLGRATREVDAVVLPHLDLEVWGRPHVAYTDMVPLETARPRTTRWQVAMAHGHFDPDTTIESGPYRPSWLISPAQIESTTADYVALGHWNRRACVSTATVQAFYSGALDYCETVNIVRLGADGSVLVSAESVD